MNDNETPRDRRRGDSVASLALIALGIAAFVYARRYDLGGLASPGPGFFPQIGAGLLVAAGAFSALASLLSGDALDQHQERQPSPAKGALRALGALAVLGAYTLALESIGFVIATPLLLGGVAWLSGAGYRASFATAAIGTLAAYGLFAKLLSVPLPPGLLGT